MYKLKDLQGTGSMESRIFNSKEEVRQALADFHSADVTGAEDMKLETLLEVGEWDLIEIN